VRAYCLAPLNVLKNGYCAKRDKYPRDLDSKVKPNYTSQYCQRIAELLDTRRRTLVTCTKYEGPDRLLDVVEWHGVSVAVDAWKQRWREYAHRDVRW
jgi:hypothetical protein